MSIMRVAVPFGDIAPRIMTNVTEAELDIIRQLVARWYAKRPRNVLRSTYYDGKMPLRPTGNIPPEAFARIRAVLGWPSKAVLGLAQRTIFDGFVSDAQAQDPFDLISILDDNRFDLELPQAIVSAFKHSCSFITTLKGDVDSGEPAVQIMARSAEWSSGMWDKRKRVVSAALSILDIDDAGLPTEMTVFLPDVVLKCSKRPSGSWTVDRRKNRFSEVLVEPLTYDPQLDRPFGRSRISRAVMNITDHALTTIVRSEIASDFYAAPRMAALGVAEDAFAKGKWDAAIDRWFAITRDEDGNLPTVQQFPQMTMQPIADQYRMHASMFAGETGLPVSSLGIVQDNPPSAEALYAAEKDLIVEARAATRVLGAALRQVARKTVMLRDNLTEAPAELRSIRANWLNPAFTSPVTAADALVKLNQVFPWLGDTEVALEYAGFSQAEVTRLLSDKRRAASGGVLNQLLAGETPSLSGESGTSALEDAQVLKARADALGVLRHAGVDAEDAAQRAGLEGVKFIPGDPITIRAKDDNAG